MIGRLTPFLGVMGVVCPLIAPQALEKSTVIKVTATVLPECKVFYNPSQINVEKNQLSFNMTAHQNCNMTSQPEVSFVQKLETGQEKKINVQNDLTTKLKKDSLEEKPPLYYKANRQNFLKEKPIYMVISAK